jgi:hypothetical protein
MKKPRNQASIDWLTMADLEMAWRRIKLDRPNRCFVIHPFLFNWIEADLQSWLRDVWEQIESGYTPNRCQICECPKPNWMVRPGAILELADELLYDAIVGHYQKQIWKGIGVAQGDPDIAYQLRRDATNPAWINSDFRVWQEWREKSLQKLRTGTQFVVSADIAGFYENIDLQRLRSDLSALGIPAAPLALLIDLLQRWAHPRGKGIPQGYSGSDILAKVYMCAVDLGLRNAGFVHLRYVDDIRIFCRDKLEAKRALLKLTELLRNRGLNVQSAKTKIERITEARQRIDGIDPLIRAINAQLIDEIKSVYPDFSDYPTFGEIASALGKHSDDPPLEVLERAFSDHFLAVGQKFDKTLLHYLLTRLGKAKSRVAVRYCLSLLSERPEETSAALRYFSDVDLSPRNSQSVLRYMASEEAIYDYQLYEIVRWFWEEQNLPSDLLSLCRKWAFDRNRQPWLRSYCVAVLGKAGDESDRDLVETQYSSATTDVEKAECVAALATAETGRRNAFYGRVRKDGDLVARAISLVKGTNR